MKDVFKTLVIQRIAYFIVIIAVIGFAISCDGEGNGCGDCGVCEDCNPVIDCGDNHDWGWNKYVSGDGLRECQRSNCSVIAGIGHTGPAGGIIFYIADGQDGRPLGFTVQGYGNPGDTGYFAEYTAYYMEVSLQLNGYDWQERLWSYLPKYYYYYHYEHGYYEEIIPGLSQSSNDETDWAIGRGRMNTAIIRNRGITIGYATTAASTCAAFTGGGKTDWFLPSKDELNLLNIVIAPNNVAGIIHPDYDNDNVYYIWSSSQSGFNRAWVQSFTHGYNSGVQFSHVILDTEQAFETSILRYSDYYFHAVRAF